MTLRNTYLVLAIVGAIAPYLFFVNFGLTLGLDLMGFLTALFANGASGGFTVDLLISSVVFWVFMINRQSGPKPHWFIVLNLTIGLSCALPAYLWATAGRSGEPV